MAISPRRRWTQTMASAAAILALAWVAVLSFRTWRAAADYANARDVSQTSTAGALGWVAAGLRWRPDEADLWRERATLAAFAEPEIARGYARRAVALAPRDWRNWRALGLLDFQLGDLSGSRRALAQATRYDHGFDSHFALANLALAQGDAEKFATEMEDALAIAPLDRVDFALRAIVSHSSLPPEGLARLLPASRPEVLARGIEFFIARGNLAAALGGWRRLRCANYQREDCRAAALSLANSLVARAFASPELTPSRDGPHADSQNLPPADMIPAAINVWNGAVREGILAQDPAAPGRVGDGEFRRSWAGPAFAWRAGNVLPLQTAAGPAGRGNAVEIAFNGYQPDHAALLAEIVPVKSGETYWIGFQSRRQLPGGETGLGLRVLATPERELAYIPARLNLQWSRNAATVTVPAGIQALELSFTFDRPGGQVRLHDPVSIADVELLPPRP